MTAAPSVALRSLQRSESKTSGANSNSLHSITDLVAESSLKNLRIDRLINGHGVVHDVRLVIVYDWFVGFLHRN